MMVLMATTSRHDPVLRTTTYETVSSFLLALAGALVLISVGVGATWFTLQSPERRPAVPVELVEEDPGGGRGRGDRRDAARRRTVEEERRMRPSRCRGRNHRRSGVDGYDSGNWPIKRSNSSRSSSTRPPRTRERREGKRHRSPRVGQRGRQVGISPRRALVRAVSRPPTVGRIRSSSDYFGIEIGVLAGGKLMYLGNLTRDPPVKRESSSGSDEKRLYMTWQGGGRRLADLQLLRKGGIEPGAGTLFHFYPAMWNRPWHAWSSTSASARRTRFGGRTSPSRLFPADGTSSR